MIEERWEHFLLYFPSIIQTAYFIFLFSVYPFFKLPPPFFFSSSILQTAHFIYFNLFYFPSLHDVVYAFIWFIGVTCIATWCTRRPKHVLRSKWDASWVHVDFTSENVHPRAHFWGVVMFSLLIIVDLHADIMHMARVKSLSEKACKTGWGDGFNMKFLLCTDAAASTACLVQSYDSSIQMC